MVEPLTVIMSSLPSLSQSISPIPPLMDSTMYFLSGEEMCGTVKPAFWPTSSNCGTGACGAWDLGGAICANTTAVANSSIHNVHQIRITREIVDYTGRQFLNRIRRERTLEL